MRWWDGQQWGVAADEVPAPATGPTAATPPLTATGTAMDAKSMAMLCHLLAIFTGLVGPLIIYLVNGEKDPLCSTPRRRITQLPDHGGYHRDRQCRAGDRLGWHHLAAGGGYRRAGA